MAIDCEAIVKQAIGRNLTDAEIEDFFRSAKRLQAQAKARVGAANQAGQVLNAARQWGNAEKLKALASKRATHLQQMRRHNAVEWVLENFKGMEVEGISALQVGSKHVRNGARLSVDAIQRNLEGSYLGGLLNDIGQLGDAHFALFRKGDLDRDVARALWLVDDPKAFKGAREAMDIARVIHAWSEKARMDQNKAGAWIAKLPGYIVRQSHDPAKMRKLGEEKWTGYMLHNLDWKRTAGGAYDPAADLDEAKKFLARTYNALVSGVHHKHEGANVNPLASASVTGTTAAKLSHERVLHFKDGDAWFTYNEQFGKGNLREAVVHGLSMAAKNTGLMRVFGPSPQANLENIIRDVREALAARQDYDGLEKLRAQARRLKNQQAEIDGSTNMDGNPKLAQIGRYTRIMENMSKLGGVLISSFSDAPSFAFEFAYHGKSFFSSLAGGIKLALKGRGSLEQQRILSACGVFYDTMTGALTSRFAGADLPGKITALQNLFFRANGLGWWTDSWKKAATLMLSHDLAAERGLAWNQLHPKRQRVLSLYGIDADDWDMMRKRKMAAADGREYLTPELAQDIGDAEISARLKAKGQTVAQGTAAAFRDDLEEKFRTYFRDRLQYAVLEPDSRTRAIIYQGTASGTPIGEALRCAMQFKSFPVAFMQRIMGRELYGYGSDTLGQGALNMFVRNQYGERNNLAMVFLMMTLFGYGSMTVKQLIAGKTPRDPGDPKTWLAAAAQGGGLGIYGDFLLGEKSRMGSSFLSSLVGPAGVSAESVYNLYQNIKEGQDVRSETFRLFFNHLPGNNLFWFRTAFDYFIGYGLYEHLNPGYISRARKRIQKENSQTFWLPPNKW